MPMPNFHVGRVQSDSGFQQKSIRTRKLPGVEGIFLLVGRRKGKTTTEPLSYRFDRHKFTAAQAKAWLKEHKISIQEFEPAKPKAELSRVSALELARSHTYRKDTLRPGRFKTQGGGILEVTPEKLAEIEGTFNQMRQNGVKVPAYATTHKEAYGDVHGGDPERIAKNCIGYVEAAIKDGDQLDLIYDFNDAEAVKVAERVQQVSACIEPKFTDGEQREYPNAITHVLLTPEPVVSGQGEFKKVACFARVDGTELDNDVAELSRRAEAELLAQYPLITEQENNMELKDLAKELGIAEDADEKACIAAITALKARPEPPKQLARESVDGLVEATEGKLSVLVDKGVITPARADKLKALVCGPEDNRNVIALSRAQSGSEKSFAAALIEILSDPETAIKSGETTGGQLPDGTAALGRDTDSGDPKAAAEKAETLKTDMATQAAVA